MQHKPGKEYNLFFLYLYLFITEQTLNQGCNNNIFQLLIVSGKEKNIKKITSSQTVLGI